MFSEAPTPLANGVGINTQAGRHDLALLAFSTGQYDPNPQRQRLSVLRRDASDVNSARSTSSSPSGAKLRTITNPPPNQEGPL
jgi:hypothetical protein